MNHEQLKKYKDRDVGMVAPDIRDLLIEWEKLRDENERLQVLVKNQLDAIHKEQAENEKLRADSDGRCRWTRPHRYSECWDTKCGNSQVITDGTPSDEEWKFCPFCGKQIEEW